VNGVMRQVKEERLLLMPANEIHRPIRQEIGQVSALGVFNRRLRGELKMHAGADNRLIKTALAGVVTLSVAEVPLAEHTRRVAGPLQGLGEGDFIERQPDDVVHRPQRAAAPVEPIDAADGIDAGAGAVLAAHERGAGGGAVWAAGIAAGKSDAACRHPINVGRFVILAAITTHVRIAKVVGENENDVRRPIRSATRKGTRQED